MLHVPQPKSRNPEGVDDLVSRWQQQGDERARDQLIREYRRIIFWYADGHAKPRGIDVEDARQECLIAFARALDVYDSSRASLVGYMRPRLWATVVRMMPYRTAVDAPSHARNNYYRARRATRELEAEGIQYPTVEQVAERSGMTVAAVKIGLQCLSSNAKSMSDPMTSDGELRFGDILPADRTTHPDHQAEKNELGRRVREGLQAALDALPKRQAQVLRMFLVDDMDQADIARQLDVTRQAVSTSLQKSLATIRPMLLADPVLAEAVLG